MDTILIIIIISLGNHMQNTMSTINFVWVVAYLWLSMVIVEDIYIVPCCPLTMLFFTSITLIFLASVHMYVHEVSSGVYADVMSCGWMKLFVSSSRQLSTCLKRKRERESSWKALS